MVINYTQLPSTNTDETSEEDSYAVVASPKLVGKTTEEAPYIVVTSLKSSSSKNPKVAIFDKDNCLPTKNFLCHKNSF